MKEQAKTQPDRRKKKIGSLSEKGVRSSKPSEAGECFMPDGGNLWLRVRQSGENITRSWVFRYRFNGKVCKFELGHYPAVALKDARRQAEVYRKALTDGRDPKHIRQATLAHNRAMLTMDELFTQWLEWYRQHGETRRGPVVASTVAGHAWRWHSYLSGELGKLPVDAVSKKDLMTTLEKMRKATREQTRKAIGTLKLVFDRACEMDLIKENPAENISPKKLAATKKPGRKRWLSTEEIRQFWTALDSSQLSPATVAALKLILLTGARRTEVIQARWNEIDIKNRTWTLPDERTKNREGHKFYLASQALEILTSLKRSPDCEWVFASDKKSGQHISPDSLLNAIERLQGRRKDSEKEKSPLANLQPFTVHDLRRTFSSGLGEHLRIHPHIIERMINHKQDALVETYQRQRNWDEQVSAWEAWGSFIQKTVAQEGAEIRSNIVEFIKPAK